MRGLAASHRGDDRAVRLRVSAWKRAGQAFLQGRALTNKRSHAEFIPHYERATALQPKEANYWFALGWALSEGRGDSAGAIQAYKTAVALEPPTSEYAKVNVPHRNHLAELLKQSGETDEAEAHLWKALDILPDDSTLHHNLGATLFRRQAYAEAEQQFRMAILSRLAGAPQD